MSERPFVPWIDTETPCICLRKRCRHARADEARSAAQRQDAAQVEALTDDDVRWLREMGWPR